MPVCPTCFNLTPTQLRVLFEYIDADSNGVLSLPEFLERLTCNYGNSLFVALVGWWVGWWLMGVCGSLWELVGVGGSWWELVGVGGSWWGGWVGGLVGGLAGWLVACCYLFLLHSLGGGGGGRGASLCICMYDTDTQDVAFALQADQPDEDWNECSSLAQISRRRVARGLNQIALRIPGNTTGQHCGSVYAEPLLHILCSWTTRVSSAQRARFDDNRSGTIDYMEHLGLVFVLASDLLGTRASHIHYEHA